MSEAVADGRRMSQRIWPVILSGGSGTRLWPLSRTRQPKQFLSLGGEGTLIQETVARAADPDGFHAPVVIGNAAHLPLIREQLQAIGSHPHLVILEPVARNTAPAIALAAHQLEREGSGGVMLVMPSDHVIADAPAFIAAVQAALPLVEQGWLVTFGIAPDAPETGYGYIRAGDPLSGRVLRVDAFVEKPDRATARSYLAQGGYYWNGGIFLFRTDRYLEELARLAPAMHEATGRAVREGGRSDELLYPDADSFAACPSDSIDYAVMEKAERVAVVPIEVGWSDIGSWDALRDAGAGDDAGNVVQGAVLAIDARDCLLRSEGPLIAAVGIADLTVVATDDAVLIAPRGRSQDVKLVIEALKARGARFELEQPVRVLAGWGEERLLSRAGRSVVRELRVRPGASFLRDFATEVQLTVLSGAAAQIGNETLVTAGGQRHLGPGVYRLASTDAEPLVLLELSMDEPG